MKYAFFCFFFIILTFNLSQAGHIYGTIKQGKSYVSGAIVTIRCGGKVFKSKKTDRYGSYSLNVRTTGKCELKIKINTKSSDSYKVYSSRKPLRYDFELYGKKGQLYLKRR